MIDFLRQFRIEGFAIFDFVVSFAGIFLIAPILSKIFRKIGLEIPKRSWMAWIIPISIAAHLIVGKMTPLTQRFINPNGHYLLKAVVIVLFLWGVLGVRRSK